MSTTDTARPARLADIVPHTYEQAAKLVGEAQAKVYTPNLAVVRWPIRDGYALCYRGTNLVTFHADGSLTLRAPSWRTSVVRIYFNAVLDGSGYSVREIEVEGNWFVVSHDHLDPKLPGGIARFRDGITIRPTAS